jgi:hypothetical protein
MNGKGGSVPGGDNGTPASTALSGVGGSRLGNRGVGDTEGVTVGDGVMVAVEVGVGVGGTGVCVGVAVMVGVRVMVGVAVWKRVGIGSSGNGLKDTAGSLIIKIVALKIATEAIRKTVVMMSKIQPPPPDGGGGWLLTELSLRC